MSAPAPKPKPGTRRLYLLLGLAGLLVLGWLYFRSRSGTPVSAANSPTGTGAVPATGSAGASDASGAAGADLLAALAGENQQLIRSFLSSSSGLSSLAGASLGAPAAVTQTATVSEPAAQPSFSSTTVSPLAEPVAQAAPYTPPPQTASHDPSPQTPAYQPGDTPGYGGGASVYGDPGRPGYDYGGNYVQPITYASIGATPEAIPAGWVEPPADISTVQAAGPPPLVTTLPGSETTVSAGQTYYQSHQGTTGSKPLL